MTHFINNSITRSHFHFHGKQAFFADVKYKKGQTRRFAPTSDVLYAKC